jgi:hypothetical protein
LIFFNGIVVFGQSQNSEDTIKITPRPERFIRVGLDLTGIGINIMEPQVRQFEISFDSEVYYNLFANLEGGTLSVLSDQSNYNYNATGLFLRFGADYNLLKRQEKTKNDVVMIGLRYSFSQINHGAANFSIPNPYWGDYEGSVENSNYNLHWAELVGSIKTEIFKNLFLGWTLRTRIRLSQTKNPVLQPYYIGGFGKGTRSAPVMIQYNLSYKFGL